MHIVVVDVTIRPEMQEEFERALLHNARESVAHDPGCRRFDVCQAYDNPARWVIFEVYDTREAHAAHKQTPHFAAYNDVATRAIVDKSVVWCADRFVT